MSFGDDPCSVTQIRETVVGIEEDKAGLLLAKMAEHFAKIPLASCGIVNEQIGEEDRVREYAALFDQSNLPPPCIPLVADDALVEEVEQTLVKTAEPIGSDNSSFAGLHGGSSR